MPDEREELVQPEPAVVTGEDDVPRLPSPPLDPYTPEPGARPGDRRAFRMMRWAWLPVALAVALVIYAALR